MLNTDENFFSCSHACGLYLLTAAVLLAVRVFYSYMAQETHEVYGLDTDGSGLDRLVSCSDIQNIPDVQYCKTAYPNFNTRIRHNKRH